jgi:colanic acid/amylovoran biosynthesis glycosyltransferase
MNLNFFTAQFPYKTGESFIENELPIISSSFDTIKIFPHYFEMDQKQRVIPTNSKIEQIDNYNVHKLNLSYKLLIIHFFLIELRLNNNKFFYLKNYRKWLSLLKQAAIKASYIESNELLLDDAVCYSFWMNDWALVLSFLKKRNVISSFVFRCGGFDIWDERHEGNYLPFRGLIYKYASKIFPNSKTAETYIREKKVFPNKVESKYFGTRDYGIGKFDENKEFTILSISNVIPLKRVELIIEILKRVNYKVKWVHFGEGSELSMIKEMAKEHLSMHKVEFKGRVPDYVDVLNYYKNNTVNLFITTSESEGLPVTIQEALSFGVPIIGTNVGGMSEVVNSRTGFLIDKNFDSNEVAHIINNWKKSEFDTLLKRQEIRVFWMKHFKDVNVYNEFSNELLKL